jgi:hypothetical protein
LADLGLQRALHAGARRKGFEQAERQGCDIDREVARRRIDRARDAQPARAQPQ